MRGPPHDSAPEVRYAVGAMNPSPTDLRGKTVVITGANQGIGKAAAMALGRRGARLLLVCRSPDKSRDAVQELRDAGVAEVELVLADVSSLSELARVGKALHEMTDRVDVLLNNAGMLVTSRRASADGYELTFATNHLAYFVLTHHLRDLLAKAPAARVVNVASDGHYFGRVDFDNLQRARGFYNPWLVYCDSKLMNVLFTLELARRLEGTGITANVLHPGVVGSNFGKTDGGLTARFVALGRPFMLSPEEGAATSVYLSADPAVEGVSGKYFAKCRPKTPARAARNAELARTLWEVSEELAGLKGGVSAS